jgi:hypothetical protein
VPQLNAVLGADATWETLKWLVPISVTLGLAFGAWMFRLERILSRLTTQAEGNRDRLDDLDEALEKEAKALWDTATEQRRRLSDTVERLAKVEARIDGHDKDLEHRSRRGGG